MAAPVPRLVTDLLDHAVAQWPDRIALDFMGRTMRYGALDAAVGRVAAGLQALGLAAGDRVCLCLPNSPYYVIAYFAVLRAGGIVVGTNPLYTAREISHLVADSGARIAFVIDLPAVHAKVAAVASLDHIISCPMAEALPALKGLAYRALKRRDVLDRGATDPRTTPFRNLERTPNAPTPVHRTPDDVAVLQYTGGTTGLPKGAMLTHGGLVANCLQVAAHDRTRTEGPETVMAVLPLFHVFALTSAFHDAIHTGARIVLLPRFEMASFLAAMKRTRPHRLYVVPTILIALNALPDNKLPATSTLRLCVSGGAPLPPEVRSRFEARTGAQVVEGYGLTEASPTVTCNPVGTTPRDGSAGVAMPGTKIIIRSLETGEALATGESGEVCVAGPQLMKGYWNRPAETAEVLADGVLRTGDVGYLDADGYLFLVDRIKDLILCGGYNVYPRVIEDALYEHAAVAEAVVIGVPDAYRGEAPKAFVVLRPGEAASPAELRGFLSTRISKIELPREIEIRDALPRTLIGKLSKKELREEGVAASG
ncbi:long-chain acyl-CoA synthetase [Sphingomonas zeicaulis]|uniref:long-chain-fatty-acid--CoA ligase n=1 Tax=Sphingomonas zeicaulis TaxID=1632740 RepID=UPI003D1A7CAB